SAEQQRWRFEQLLEVLVSCDRHLVPYQEVWEIVQQLLLGSPDLKPEEAYELTLEAFQAAGDLQGVQESRSRLARSQEESPAQVVPRITNFTEALQALGVPFTEPTATPSRSRELFRYVRKKRRQAIWRDPFGPQTPEESPAEPQAEVNASAVEAGLFQLLASGAPFREVKLKLKEDRTALEETPQPEAACWDSFNRAELLGDCELKSGAAWTPQCKTAPHCVSCQFAPAVWLVCLYLYEENLNPSNIHVSAAVISSLPRHQLFQAAKLPLTSRRREVNVDQKW
ncbi:unnamed protein product, partial [Effrenium voratum]